MTTREEKIQNAMAWLNHEAYLYQAGKLKGKRKSLASFTPCPKAEVYLRACNDNRVFSEIWSEVVRTECKCHAGYGADELLDMEHDDAARRAHYRPTAELYAEMAVKSQARRLRKERKAQS